MDKPPFRPAPTAMACGILQDKNRILFLKQKGRDKVERIGLPFVMLFAGQDPVKKMTDFFLEQTGIDGHVQNVQWQTRHNAGSRKNKRLIPVLAFRVEAKNRQAKPGAGYGGYAWLTFDDARKQKLEKSSEWILQLKP